MKILIVAYKFGTMEEIGKNLGSYDYFLNQVINLNKSGAQVTVLAPWVKFNKPGSLEVDGVKIVRYWPKLATRRWRNLLAYKLINKIYIWRTGQMTKKLVKNLDIDVVYVRQARETGYAVAKVKESIKVPTVFQPITTWRWHFENKDLSILKKIVKDTSSQKKYADKILQSFDHFVTYDHAMIGEYVALGADKNKFTVIPPAVRHDFFKPLGNKSELRKELGLPMDKKLIINVSRVNIKEKGHQYMLEGFRKVIDQRDDVNLIIIGPGTVEQVTKLKNIIKDQKLENQVQYLGSKPYNTLPEYMSASDIGILPSIWFEAFGRTTLDMIACGLPMITTTVGGMPEANLHNVTGINVEPENSQAIADAIIKITSDDELRNKMSQQARQRTLEIYTFEKIVSQFMEVFKKVI